MIKYTVLLCLLALLGSALSQCVQDYECGNLPYSVCNGGVNECSNTVPGLAFDAASGDIYFAQVCRTFQFLSNITIKKIGASGGVSTVVQSRIAVPAPGNPERILGKVGDYLYLALAQRQPGPLLVTLKLSTLEQSGAIDTGSGAYFQPRLDFDVADRKTVACNFIPQYSKYTIDSYNGILGQDVTTSTTLYNLPLAGACTGVRISGSDVYFSVSEYVSTTTKIYKGSMTSVNSNITSAQLLFSIQGAISDFFVAGQKFFYATATGVYSSDLTGNNTIRLSWASGASGVIVVNNKLYWNSGAAILSVNLDGTGLTQLNRFSGSCGCRPGFTGSSCSTCNGQVQWLNGAPTCVKIGTDGNPVTCNNDYECTDSPYYYCGGTCQCRYGFSGAHCNQCTNSSKSIVWTNGYPFCE